MPCMADASDARGDVQPWATRRAQIGQSTRRRCSGGLRFPYTVAALAAELLCTCDRYARQATMRCSPDQECEPTATEMSPAKHVH